MGLTSEPFVTQVLASSDYNLNNYKFERREGEFEGVGVWRGAVIAFSQYKSHITTWSLFKRIWFLTLAHSLMEEDKKE